MMHLTYIIREIWSLGLGMIQQYPDYRSGALSVYATEARLIRLKFEVSE